MVYLELKYFKLVAAISEVGSLAKAADMLFLTQPALSHQLKDIESQLGTKVFNRVNKRLVLTDVGELMLKHSLMILNEVDHFKHEMETYLKKEGGTIRLGAESHTCFHWLPKILKHYQAEFPNIDVRLETNNTNKPIDLLQDGKLDFVIVYRKKESNSISYTHLFTDSVVALVPSTSSLAQKKYLTSEDFKDTTYITHSDNLKKSIFYDQFLKPESISPKQVLHIQMTDTVVEMVSEGLGISVMANWLAKPYLDSPNISAIKLGKNGLKRDWFIATLSDDLQKKPMIRFLDLLKLHLTNI